VPTFPFSAIVAQDELRHALSLCVVDPGLGGVLVFGDRGTGKSTAVRALAGLLPHERVVTGCPYRCDPYAPTLGCPHGCDAVDGQLPSSLEPVRVVDLPLGVSDDRVVGALDLEAALVHGERRFAPGLLARAHRGFLYIDEVNLLPDHIVDLLLDVAASGENVVEREGLSVRHPARFVLIGSGNPEEGDLRPQLLDRFGLALDLETPTDIPTRVEIVRRRAAFEADPAGFVAAWSSSQEALRTRLLDARDRLVDVVVPDAILERAASLCVALGTDGVRGELTLTRASRACAALDGDLEVTLEHVRRVGPMALRHRLRRNPLDDARSSARVERAVSDTLGA
jgi:magnesium chelatase subunit I